MDWSSIFAESLPYSAFLDKYATPVQRTALGRFACAGGTLT